MMSTREVACIVRPFPNRNTGRSSSSTWYLNLVASKNRSIVSMPQADSVAPVSTITSLARTLLGTAPSHESTKEEHSTSLWLSSSCFSTTSKENTVA